uniref:acylaminoacyl-peptidase n=1 Tax=Kalanchoe fedtschenkoi TaxID=63787 RepID=A0A7N1A4T8_KALFE
MLLHKLFGWLNLVIVTRTCNFPSPNRTCSNLRFVKKLSIFVAMDGSKPDCEDSLGLDDASKEEYISQSKWLKEFAEISNVDKAWILKSEKGKGSKAMFSLSRPDLLANKKRNFVLSAHVSRESNDSISFNWSPFPVEMSGVSALVPSPSGSKLLIIRNPENDSPTKFEVWSPSQLEKEFLIAKSFHGSVYVDGWFEGISWDSDENAIAYVAEEPTLSKPTFNSLGFKENGSADKDCCSWKGQGDYLDDWGETYKGKNQPALFVLDVNSGEVKAVKGIPKTLSVGQVVWAPPNKESYQYLVFVGWSYGSRKLGIKYCYNRPCAIYGVKAPSFNKLPGDNEPEDSPAINLTQSISSGFFPRFSPDGKFLVFLSAKSSVDSGAHSATESLHKIEWPVNGELTLPSKIMDVVPVVMSPDSDCFPGLYCSSFLSNPWLSDKSTMIISSAWRSTEVILSVNVLSGEVTRISPVESDSWNVVALDGDNIVAVRSSPVEVSQVSYGVIEGAQSASTKWNWLDISSPIPSVPEKVKNVLSSLQYSILKVPVNDTSIALTKGAKNPYEAIFVSSKTIKNGSDPVIVIIHGGPHSVSSTNFSKSVAYLASLGYSLLIVNYRGSTGFGEEALQSLPGNIGTQDVNDVLAAIDQVIQLGLADASKINLLGGSHGGFLSTHLIGQAPNKFAAAAVRNPVCNLALMTGTSDIPDWCYVETFGTEGKALYTEAPTAEQLTQLYDKSPIKHIDKVKTPTLFLIGAQDLRVPPSNGIHYMRALKERGVEVKLIVFPEDVHSLSTPRADYESVINIGVWFKRFCK